MKILSRVAHFSRPVKKRRGHPEDFAFSYHKPQIVAAKPVFLGQHNPGDHYASAAKVFVPHDQLYGANRRQR